MHLHRGLSAYLIVVPKDHAATACFFAHFRGLTQCHTALMLFFSFSFVPPKIPTGFSRSALLGCPAVLTTNTSSSHLVCWTPSLPCLSLLCYSTCLTTSTSSSHLVFRTTVSPTNALTIFAPCLSCLSLVFCTAVLPPDALTIFAPCLSYCSLQAAIICNSN